LCFYIWCGFPRFLLLFPPISLQFWISILATIRQRGDHQFEARIRRKGLPTICKTFIRKVDAEDWALLTEADMRRGLYLPRREAEKTTFKQVATRFETEYGPVHYKGPA
jgi:hypothetical protein